jgi:hypothetical protein
MYKCNMITIEIPLSFYNDEERVMLIRRIESLLLALKEEQQKSEQEKQAHDKRLEEIKVKKNKKKE